MGPLRNSGAVPPDRGVAYVTPLTGVSADNSIWQGSLEGNLRGRVGIALRQAESPGAAAHPG